MKSIKNIIFDLGGVVIDLARENAVSALTELGVEDTERLLGEYAQQGEFLKLETGEITVAEFYDNLMPRCHKGTTCKEIQDAFNRFLVKLPIERLRELRALREAGYKVYMLSNTNPVMFDSWIDEAFRQEGLTVNDYFDGIVTSYKEHVCKPDPRIFENIIRRYSLNGEETLFLDDSEANCESARKTGLHALHIDNSGSDSMLAVSERLRKEAARS